MDGSSLLWYHSLRRHSNTSCSSGMRLVPAIMWDSRADWTQDSKHSFFSSVDIVFTSSAEGSSSTLINSNGLYVCPLKVTEEQFSGLSSGESHLRMSWIIGKSILKNAGLSDSVKRRSFRLMKMLTMTWSRSPLTKKRSTNDGSPLFPRVRIDCASWTSM